MPQTPSTAADPQTTTAHQDPTDRLEPHDYDYDVLVVGSGPGGQHAAVTAAKLGYQVGVIDRRAMVGGVCVNTGTIPSKTLREAVMFLTGSVRRSIYGESHRPGADTTMSDLTARTQHVIGKELEVIRGQLQRNHVDVFTGTASFVDSHTLNIEGYTKDVTAARIILAPGTTAVRPESVEFDGIHVIDSDGLLELERIPGSMVVVGAGVIGIEYASIFAALGARVTVVDSRNQMLEFCDHEVMEWLRFHLRDLAVSFRFGETVESVQVGRNGALTTLESGKRIPSELVLYSAGRHGATQSLGLDKAGILVDKRGRLKVDEHYRTKVGHIYAVGDVIGFPALASTSMAQGRLAALHAVGAGYGSLSRHQPIGIYTIPEISFVGANEAELTASSTPYEVGVARYRELARGQIMGDSYGVLKLLVHSETREILGVHVFGTSATELVHIGQVVMGLGGTIDFLVESVFNYPTLSEAYKVAALDVANKLYALQEIGPR
ncbi:MAG: Si-specific NAD(P)(+) transhydrogenase [Micrococcales bacterium]|nr:MAG: Si-specific NAD(P)(+) transhydrogenase [Micrococcales bacterium]